MEEFKWHIKVTRIDCYLLIRFADTVIRFVIAYFFQGTKETMVTHQRNNGYA
jgi:hypothetical protein